MRLPFIALLWLLIADGAPALAQAPSSQPSASPLPTATAAEPSASPSLSPVPLPPAGVVPPEVTVVLGGLVSPAFAQERIVAEIARNAQLGVGVSVTVRGVTILAPLQPGDALEAIASVTIAGGASLAPVAGTTAVHLSAETLDRLDPAFLFYSDDPERLAADTDGVLYRDAIATNKSARVYAYHVSDAPGRLVYLTLSATAAARVQLLGTAAGPADAFGYVGHISTLRYLLERGTQESVVLDLAPGEPYAQQLGTRALDRGELIAAIFDLRVLEGGPVDVAVVSVPAGGEVAALLGGAELPGDGHGRRGEFALGPVPPLALGFALGGAEPDPFEIGIPSIPNLRPGGRALGGDYGVLRAVALSLSNPQTTPQNVYFYEQAEGGAATTSIWFTGDPAPTEIPCIKVAENRYLVKAFALGPGEQRTVTGEYMTDGSSSFPLDFGLTATPPSPPPGPYAPDACNPKPLPSPSPSPSSEPVPSPSPAAT